MERQDPGPCLEPGSASRAVSCLSDLLLHFSSVSQASQYFNMDSVRMEVIFALQFIELQLNPDSHRVSLSRQDPGRCGSN